MTKIIKPPRLRPGEVIGIVAPASPMKPDLLENGIKYLEARGYRVKLGRHVYQERGYLAGTDEQRADDLNRMFRDKQIKAIFCARGGYGTPRLLPLLDYDAMRRHPKIFVGYSDVTAIQFAILKHAGLVTFSGPMVAAEMGKGITPFTEEKFWRLITEPVAFGALDRLGTQSYATVKSGSVTGQLVGGCLSLIATIVGTPHMPSLAGRIFFVEEVGEDIYRLDRWFVHLREAGIFRKIGGFLLGQTLNCGSSNNDPTLSIDDLMEDFIKPLGIPAVSSLDYGHGRDKYTMPLGVRGRLEVEPGFKQFAIVEPAVT